MSEFSPTLVVRTIPLWLETEAAYANAKYGEQNPQLTASIGGLQPGGVAYRDFSQYLHRFDIFHSQSGGSEQIMLQASQQLGKWLSSGRALLRVVLQQSYGVDRDVADNESFDICDELALGLNKFPEVTNLDTPKYRRDHVEPYLGRIGAAFLSSSDGLPATKELVSNQFALFAAVTAQSGIVAEPGRTSGDVRHWMVPTP